MRHWNNTIGNLRVLSLEQNRSENNRKPVNDRLVDTKEISFIKENDWVYWKQLHGRVNDGDPNVKVHLNAVIYRLCNVYGEWYNVLNIERLFSKPINTNV
jgi:hypothetical protein